MNKAYLDVAQSIKKKVKQQLMASSEQQLNTADIKKLKRLQVYSTVSLILTLLFCYAGIWLAWHSGFYTLSILFYQGILSTLKSLKLFSSLMRCEHTIIQHDNNNVETMEKPNFFLRNSFDIAYHLTIISNYLLLLFNYYYKTDIILWGNVCMVLAFKEIHMSYMKVRRKYLKYKRFKTFTSRFPQVPSEELAFEEKCSICHETLLVARRVQCGHVFHMKCLYSWLKNHPTCPMCRSQVWENELPNVQNNNSIQQFFTSMFRRFIAPLQNLTQNQQAQPQAQAQAQVQAADQPVAQGAQDQLPPTQAQLAANLMNMEGGLQPQAIADLYNQLQAHQF
jgi:hypothetical protein